VALPPLGGDVGGARKTIEWADTLVARARADGRRVLLVASTLPATDSASQPAANAWTNLTTEDAVEAVLAVRGPGVAHPAWKFVRTPPLGASASAPARGFSWIALRAGAPRVSRVSFDPGGGGFTRNAEGTGQPAPPNGRLARLRELGAPMGEPARTAIFWMSVLTAFLTVAALWKVPDTVVETTTVNQVGAGGAPAAGTTIAADGAGATTTLAGTAPAGASTQVVSQTVSQVTSGQSGVFDTNLGRTILSGLTGIAVVTVLKELWGISGTAGQAFFVIIFIIFLFGFLLLSAILRAVIDAFQSRVATGYQSVEISRSKHPWWTRLRLWAGSYRPTGVIFGNTFTSVLFGQAGPQSLVWTRRYFALQQSLLAGVDSVREEVSDAVGQALRDAGFPDARAERDYRVNVSLLESRGLYTYYISSARRSLAKVFGDKSVAWLAIRSGEARWWKLSYENDHDHLHSKLRLRGTGSMVPRRAIRLDDLVAEDPATRAPTPAGPGATVTVNAVRGDGTAVVLTAVAMGTLGELLARLNEEMGNGTHPAAVSLDADGYLVVSASGSGRSQLGVVSLRVGAAELGPFVPAVTSDAVLFDNTSKVLAGLPAQPLLLKEYFENRGTLDYAAFAVIPVPLTQRGLASGDRRAGIHISFRTSAHADALWPALDRVVVAPPAAAGAPAAPDLLVPNYAAQHRLIEPAMLPHPALAAVLAQGVRVASELIQQINDTWYWSRPACRP
jgi:hypothetical protein